MGNNTIKPKRRMRVFISYSRADSNLVDSLSLALEARAIESLIDRRDIEKLEDWWMRIENLIASADAFVFVISPDSVASDICNKEVATAARLNKRLAPILYRTVAAQLVP